MQDLNDVNAITFMLNGPNINNNPMPPHISPSMSVLEEYGGKKTVSSVDNIKTSLAIVKEQLLMNEVYPNCDIDYEHCLISPQVCEKLNAGVQNLIDRGIMLVEQLFTVDEVDTFEIPLVQLMYHLRFRTIQF